MKLKRWKLLTVLIAAFVLVATVSVSVYAYFSTRVYVYTEDGKEVAHLGMNLQLLFGKLKVETTDSNGVEVGTSLEIPYYAKVDADGNILPYDQEPADGVDYYNAKLENPEFDPNAPWGSPQNPYIIANERHLQNLSALQNIGYFDMMYIEKNFDKSTTDGKTTYTYNNGISMPYFLICDESGKPVVIDATEIGEIKPVGSAEHPFIGVVGGAFASGDPVTVGETGKTTSVSTLHGVKVQTNTDQTDVGLFGYVGYLGTEPTEPITDSEGNTVYETQFTGATSILQDFLLSDVQIIVKEPSLAETLSEIFGPIWEAVFGEDGADSNNHRFSYTNSGETNPPKEDHHIGILAGHVSYATVENISVYYSSNSIYALDVTGTNDTDNYYSESGILGFMFNMNALVQNVMDENNTAQYADHCQIMMGTGTTSDDMEIPVVGSGSGTGGGLESGSGRGYVTAAEIFSQFNNVNTSAPNNELLWNYQPQSGNLVTGAILIFKHPTSGEYYFADGETKATISGNTVSDSNNNSWDSFFILERQGTEEITYSYKTPSGDPIASIEPAGNLINGKEVWKYQAGGDGIWHYGVRINFDGTSYKLADGGEAVTINTEVRPVKPTATVGDTTYTFENFFVVDTRTNEAYIFDPFEAGTTVKVTSFNHKPLDLIDGVTADGTTKLCEEWMRERLLGFLGFSKEASGMYYFYDGVFTFALSSLDDTITDTWENDQAPTLHLGANQDDAWTVDSSSDNKTVAALLTPIRNNAMLDAAISAGKQLYISAKPGGANSNDAFLMSLPNSTNSESNTTAAPIPGTMFQLDETLIDTIYEGYSTGQLKQIPTVPITGQTEDENMEDVDLDDLKTRDFWEQYTILNIGRTNSGANLKALRTQYNVAATQAKDDNGNIIYQYYDTTGAYVTPSNGQVTQYTSWDGYFFYRCVDSQVIAFNTTYTYDGLFINYTENDVTTRFTLSVYYQEKVNGSVVEIGNVTFTEITQETVYNLNPTLSSFTPASINDFQAGAVAAVNSSGLLQPATSAVQGQNMYSGYKKSGETDVTPVSGRFLDANTGVWSDTTAIPMLNYTVDPPVFHSTAAATSVKGSIVSLTTGGVPKYYYYEDVTNGNHYDSDDNWMSDDEVAAAKANGWVLLNRYPCYNFMDAARQSYLQIINQYTGTFFGQPVDWGNKYSLWSGTQDQYNLLDRKTRGQNRNGVLVFEDNSSEDDPYCLIRYTLDSTSYYVGYDYTEGTTASGTFRGETKYDIDSPIKLYVYVIEGIIDMDYGVNTFVPTTSDPALEFAADEYVLWPQTTLKQNGTYSNNGKTQVNTSQNATMATTTDPIYNLVPLQGSGGLNWGSANGYLLGKEYGLHQKFQMKDQAGFGTMVNILGGNWEIGGSYGEYSMLVAPIGSNGVEATIPKGCVAFRVNTNQTETVRVIVAIPTTEYYVGEGDFNLDLVNDYYIGVWNVAAANENTTFEFNKSDALEKFELPRSHTFHTEATPGSPYPNDAEVPASYTEYVKVSYGGSTYRTYLNGDCFLVAYEFTVTGEGVYIIGSAHGNTNAATDKDAAMEIVHFSVSGTASAGRDGIAGSKLGSVDFVYDQNDAIITVDKTGLTGGLTNAAGNEDYASYYASQCLLHTNNAAKDDEGQYVLINNARVSIRRYVAKDTNGNGVTTIAYAVGPPKSGQQGYVVVDQYMTNADTVERTEETDSTS